MKSLYWLWIVVKMIIVAVIVIICFFPALPYLGAADELDYELDEYGWKKWPYGAFRTLLFPFELLFFGVFLLYETATGRDREGY